MKHVFTFLLFIFSQVLSAADLPSNHPSIKDALDADGIVADKTSNPLPNMGTVVDTIHSKGYTYIELKDKEKNVWLAAPKVELTKDTMVRYGRGIPMVNFYSNGLKREFPEIYFVERVQIVE